jgi:hypothetical protein
MTSFPDLERHALESRARFTKTLDEIKTRITAPELTNQALALADPRLKRVKYFYMAVKRHPLAALGAIAGAGWLIRKMQGLKNSERHHPSKPPNQNRR